MTERKRCGHLVRGELAMHATVRLKSVPPERNTTSYQWDEEVDLCVFCSGKMRGFMLRELRDLGELPHPE